MNEIFNFHKKLNLQKIIIISIILLFIIVVLVELISNALNKMKENKNIVTTQTFYDENKSLSIALPSTYKLEQNNTTSNYLIEIKSPQSLQILISKKELISERSLSDIVFADRNAYTKNYQEISNVSEISSILVNKELESYTYTFDYKNDNQKYCIQIIWIKAQDGYYIIDINYLETLKNTFSNLVKEITSSFNIY